jgi:nucleotide-binding universal stress UspA family protein
VIDVRDGGPVVVGISADGSGRGLGWAAAEAGAQRCPLRVVHAVRPPSWAVDPYGFVPLDGSAVMAATQMLHAAVTRIRALATDVDVSGVLLSGPTIPALLRQAHDARLLVLGGGDRSPRTGLRDVLAPSVSGRVAARAGCPVAVVRRLQAEPRDGSPPRVVVGVDGEGSSTVALGFAFRAAAQRGLSVTAVHAWRPDVPADFEAVSGSAASAEARAHAVLERALQPWLARYADVRVQCRPCRDEPMTALVAESKGAALVVVGSQGRGAAQARLPGSVSCRFAERAHSPVVVAHPRTVPNDPFRRADRAGAGSREDEPQHGTYVDRGRHRGDRTGRPWPLTARHRGEEHDQQ